MKKKIPIKIAENTPNLMIESRIKTIRGVQVMLDTDLAELYDVETKAINRAVKRNILRFPPDFYFELSSDEWASLKCQIGTSKVEGRGGRRYNPYVFTEQGVSMLSSVLRSDVADFMSVAIMRAFVKMRHMLMLTPSNTENSVLQLSLQIHQHSHKIEHIEKALNNFTTKEEVKKILLSFGEIAKHFVILDGHKFEADIAYTQIYGMAKHSIIVIDNYLDVKTLDLLRCVADGVKVTILSDQYGGCRLTPLMKADFEAVRPGVLQGVKPAKNRFHDRYIVLDFGIESEKMYHCGASSKDAGGKITTIMEIENPEVYRKVIEELL